MTLIVTVTMIIDDYDCDYDCDCDYDTTDCDKEYDSI